MSERGPWSPDPTGAREALTRLQRDAEASHTRLRGSAVAVNLALIELELQRRVARSARVLAHRLHRLSPSDQHALAADLTAACAAVNRAEIQAGHVTHLLVVIAEWDDARCVDECRG